MTKNPIKELFSAPSEAPRASADASHISPGRFREALPAMNLRLNEVGGGTTDVIEGAARTMDPLELSAILRAANYVTPAEMHLGQAIQSSVEALPEAENELIHENPELGYAQYTGDRAPAPEDSPSNVIPLFGAVQASVADAAPVVDSRYAEPALPMYQEIGQQGVQPYSAHEQYVDQAFGGNANELDRQAGIQAAQQQVDEATGMAA